MVLWKNGPLEIKSPDKSPWKSGPRKKDARKNGSRKKDPRKKGPRKKDPLINSPWKIGPRIKGSQKNGPRKNFIWIIWKIRFHFFKKFESDKNGHLHVNGQRIKRPLPPHCFFYVKPFVSIKAIMPTFVYSLGTSNPSRQRGSEIEWGPGGAAPRMTNTRGFKKQ